MLPLGLSIPAAESASPPHPTPAHDIPRPDASPAAAAKRALFDNFHAEQAGNADWVIDNNQPTPAPAQELIVPSTARTYWTGAISSWGVDLVKRGYTVTINNAALTHGNAANPLDLTNFDVLIVPEPNTRSAPWSPPRSWRSSRVAAG